MKVTKETLRILKNFSCIENSIWVDEKKILKIINSSGSVIGIAEIEDELPTFGIYNLSEFIQALTMFEEPELEFDLDSLASVIKQGKRKVNIRLTPSDLIPFKAKASEVYIKHTKTYDAAFKLTEEQMNGLLKAARIFSCDLMQVKMENGTGDIHLFASKNSSNNTFTENIEGEKDGKIIVMVDNFNFLPGDYNVSFTSQYIKFENQQTKVFYIVTAYTGPLPKNIGG